MVRAADGETILAGEGRLGLAARPGGRIRVGPFEESGPLAIEAAPGVPSESAVFAAADGRWRGALVVETAGGGLRILNRLPLEAYLRGVVPLEMPHDWPAAALEAQAIAARTYAYARAIDPAVPYLQRGVADQVYGGAAAERPSTDAAVAATDGRVLLWDGRPFVSYFHSSCGGHTDAPPAALGRDAPPAHGVPDTYCLVSPHALWTATVRGRLRPVRVSPGGRLAVVEWDGRRMTGNEFRLAVGATRVRSMRAVLEPIPGGTRLRGRGWGHGAGLCQWGARGRAIAGFPSDEILLHYYPGARIGSLDDLRLPQGIR